MRRKHVAPPPWYTRFFGADYLRVFAPYLTPERTEHEILGILRLLNLQPGACILDLACGYGRHSIPMAALDYRMAGLDLSQPLLARAAESARSVSAQVSWVLADMRHVPFTRAFDAVINIFTSFGYLETREDDVEVLRNAQRALVPGGAFLLETVSRDALIRHFTPTQVERRAGGLLVLQEQEFDPADGRLTVRLTLVDRDGTRREHRQSIRFYTLTELLAMLGEAGLRLEGAYGDLDASSLNIDSRRLVLLARRA